MPDKNAKYKVRDITEPIKVDVTLAVDQIFVCGDNRGNSTDSRYFGPLKVSSVVGKVSFRVMPFNKINRL